MIVMSLLLAQEMFFMHKVEIDTLQHSNSARSEKIAYAILFFLAICIFGLFIFRTRFTIEGKIWFTLIDDAMISMRYKKPGAWIWFGMEHRGTPNPGVLQSTLDWVDGTYPPFRFFRIKAFPCSYVQFGHTVIA
jgi:hypothetical protein